MKYLSVLCVFLLLLISCTRDDETVVKGPNQYIINSYVGTFNGATYELKPDWFKEPIQVNALTTVITEFTPGNKVMAYSVGAYLDDWSQATSYELFISKKGASNHLLTVTLQGTNEVTGWYYRDVSPQGLEVMLEAGVEYEAGMVFKNPLKGNAFAVTSLVKNQLPILPFTAGSMLCNGTSINGQASANYRLDGVVDIGYYTMNP